MIHKIPPELFDQGYRHFSFDVTSFFTNVPLNKTINIILKRIYKEKLVNTKLRKNTLKKLRKDCCIKTAFFFYGIICKQKDGVSMGSSLGLALAKNIMTELERVIVEPLISSGKTRFYIEYVNDTLLLAKEEGIKVIFDKFNSFHKNLRFTIDDNNINFLDITIDKNNIDLYYKPTHTGQYSEINSNVPWNYKISWIKSLYQRAEQICSSSEKFTLKINKIKIFVSWNGYPSFTHNSIIKRLKTSRKKVKKEKDDRKIKWIRLPYLGNTGKNKKKNCFKKVEKYLKENVRFITCYETKKSGMFCSAKVIIPINQKAKFIYKVICPGCNEDYVTKTDRKLLTKLNEHASRDDQPIYQHLLKFTHATNLLRLPDIDASTKEISGKQHFVNTVISSFCLLKTCCN